MDGTRRPVVVGVDGSLPGRGALRRAPDHAPQRGRPIREPHAPGSADPELWAAARAMLAEAVAEARALQPGVEVSGKVIDGSPVTELCSASETAPLVVVAGRWIGGFTGLLLC